MKMMHFVRMRHQGAPGRAEEYMEIDYNTYVHRKDKHIPRYTAASRLPRACTHREESGAPFAANREVPNCSGWPS